MNNLHGIVFAYQKNAGLRELTEHRNTSSIPFAGRYRLIDFALSNLVSAGVTDVGLVVHSSYQSLLDHVGSGKPYDLSRQHGGLKILPPFSYANRIGSQEYQGHMDALNGVYSYLTTIKQDYVVLCGSDMAVNLPLNEMYHQHIDSGADLTIMCTRAPTGKGTGSDYFTLGADGWITDAAINPIEPVGCESMGVYILSKELLLRLVAHCASHNIHSMVQAAVQEMSSALKIAPFFFEGYFARIQTLSDYYNASMEILNYDVRKDLFQHERPIATKDNSTPATYYGPDAKVDNSLIADGCQIEGTVENCVLFRNVYIAKGAVVRNCVLMKNTVVGADAQLSCVVSDKSVQISEARTLIGHENYPIAIAKYEVV